MRAGVVGRASESTWTSHRAYLRLDAAPSWLDVARGLDILGFADTAAGRRRFDEFVMTIDLNEPWIDATSDDRPELATCRGEPRIDWKRLVALARAVTELPQNETLISRRRPAVKTRLVIALIATKDLGQSYATVAAQLGMSVGAVFNLVSRSSIDANVQSHLAALRGSYCASD